MKSVSFRLALMFALLPLSASAEYRVGAAAVDITPDYPVRLSGFGFRRAESEGVTQKIWGFTKKSEQTSEVTQFLCYTQATWDDC